MDARRGLHGHNGENSHQRGHLHGCNIFLGHHRQPADRAAATLVFRIRWVSMTGRELPTKIITILSDTVRPGYENGEQGAWAGLMHPTQHDACLPAVAASYITLVSTCGGRVKSLRLIWPRRRDLSLGIASRRAKVKPRTRHCHPLGYQSTPIKFQSTNSRT
jgi:hypothetical protein